MGAPVKANRLVEEDIVDDEEIILVSTDKIIGEFSEGSIIVETENGYFRTDEEEEIGRRISNFELTENLFDE